MALSLKQKNIFNFRMRISADIKPIILPFKLFPQKKLSSTGIEQAALTHLFLGKEC
jgi:hypothetical protein